MMIISAEISSHEFVGAQFMEVKEGGERTFTAERFQLLSLAELFLIHAYKCVCVYESGKAHKNKFYLMRQAQ
jgi:hypothetical protein